jgi:hypothetical protein
MDQLDECEHWWIKKMKNQMMDEMHPWSRNKCKGINLFLHVNTDQSGPKLTCQESLMAFFEL